MKIILFSLCLIMPIIHGCGDVGTWDRLPEAIKIVDTLSRREKASLLLHISSYDCSKIPEKNIIFPWEDCAAHLNECRAFRVPVTNQLCPACHQPIVIIPFSSPASTWKMLCGRMGEFYVCPNCLRQYWFRCFLMN